MAVLSDYLETMLETVNRSVPKEEFRNVDNTPKHLLHMTDEDFMPKTQEELADDLKELIKEAKSKIKPVLMNSIDREKYIDKMENFKRDQENGVQMFDM